MIPKKIHYCWFGRNPLPEDAQKCIASWREFFPDYEIIEWNEDNFDVNTIPYTAEAYSVKKYAFVSDFARFKILYEHGGLYFDTDVEVIKSFEDILAKGPFMGCEISNSKQIAVNPGLGLGAKHSMSFYKKVLEYYESLHFLNTDGTPNMKTVVSYTTELLENEGLRFSTEVQEIAGITIYPKDYFNPLDDNTGILKITPNTHSIHWYSKTWLKIPSWRIKASRLFHRIFGTEIGPRIKRFFRR